VSTVWKGWRDGAARNADRRAWKRRTLTRAASRSIMVRMSDFCARDVVRFTRVNVTHVGHLQYRYVNNPSWLVAVPGHGEMWVEEAELEHVRDPNAAAAT
jgi:hypothetical protein